MVHAYVSIMANGYAVDKVMKLSTESRLIDQENLSKSIECTCVNSSMPLVCVSVAEVCKPGPREVRTSGALDWATGRVEMSSAIVDPAEWALAPVVKFEKGAIC